MSAVLAVPGKSIQLVRTAPPGLLRRALIPVRCSRLAVGSRTRPAVRPSPVLLGAAVRPSPVLLRPAVRPSPVLIRPACECVRRGPVGIPAARVSVPGTAVSRLAAPVAVVAIPTLVWADPLRIPAIGRRARTAVPIAGITAGIDGAALIARLELLPA